MESIDSLEKEKYYFNKVAIVTGGSRGIGASISKKLAKIGYKVVLNYNHSEENAKMIAEESSNITIFKADISDENDAKKLINFAISKFGRIDILVNNAGIDLIKPLTDTTTNDFDKIMKTNLYSAFYTSREASKFMINKKDGIIINISSIWGITGASCEMAYAVSKAGLDAMTKSLAKELGPSNIRVNSIAPGIIDTDMNKNLSEADKNEIIKEIPLEKIGTTKDIADCVEYLINAEYVTGQVIQVNGGWNI